MELAVESQAIHPLAPEHIPGYVAGADGSDVLFTAMAIFGIVLIIGLGVLYLTLHSIPERMAHKSSHPQLQIVGILALLALFTHNNLFWVAAVLVAGFQFPDMLSPLQSIARSLAKLAGRPIDENVPEGDAPQPAFRHHDGEG
ncbi:hypothetical protein [Alloyangia pacifica]|uniref:hypothetical protein n=1 Tax=Alloyangia pacifica TaxID=311180 RepID=UPI0019432B79|nr:MULTISPECIES: hypothetical protein [Roseobacteraceae]MCA0993987.1 hypothetical protein [Alloyangia pacifica]